MKKIEILKRIKENEKNKTFSAHIVPPKNKIIQVTGNYKYIKKGFFNKVKEIFAIVLFKLVTLLVAPYCKLKIVGKENLKGIKSAILTSNHINNIDCLLIKRAFYNKRLKITVAEFNNIKGPLGNIMRSATILPLGKSISSLKNLSSAISEYLKKDSFVLFYPEGSLWWCYEKPRPLISGAYYYAVKNNVPIIPLFFTFKNLKKRKDGSYKKQFILNIGKPIFPDVNLLEKQNIEYLKNLNFDYNKKVYEEFYNKKLEYI